jgi:hypothetical protein
MTPTSLLNLIPSVGNASSPSAAAASASLAIEDAFSSQLATSIATATANKAAADRAASAQTQATVQATAKTEVAASDEASQLATLQNQIAAALKAGQSVSTIVTQLAHSLATKVAAKLGLTSDDAKKQLQAAFVSALSPPGTAGPPLTLDQQAQALAQTYLQTASVAAGVVNGESGQLNRIVGTVLDADQAKANPAPTSDTPTTTAQNAQDLATSVISGATPALIATAVPAGDGRRVTLADDVPTRSSGGDTLLGRVLTRAALASTPAPIDPAAPAVSGAAILTTAPAGQSGGASLSSAAQDLADTLLGESASSQSFISGESAPAPAASAPGSGVAAFLQAFASALSSPASAAAALGARGKSPSSDASLLVGGSSNTEAAATFVPSVPTFSISQANAPATAGATQSAAAQTPADPSAVVEQVLRGAFLQTNGTSSTIRLSLLPENLGDVSVKLAVDGTGNVSAHITAQTAEAGSALVQGQSQLTRSLADAGLKLTSFTVDVSNSGLGGNPSGQQQSSQQSSAGRRVSIAGLEAGSSSGDESDLLAVPSFGPPIVASRTLGAYNYLA